MKNIFLSKITNMFGIISNKGTNAFVSFLKCTKVKYTNAMANRIYNEHPNKYNLLGISQMLKLYGIENVGLTVWNREEDLMNIHLPFIAYVGDEFVVIYKITQDKVFYISNGEDIDVSISRFWKLWTGVILLCEVNEKSMEPDYYKNLKDEIISNSLFILLIISLISGIIISAKNTFQANIDKILLIINSTIGLFFTFMLLTKQLKVNSAYVNKICTIIKEGNCNDILESKAAYILGVSWSEIGFGYFVANLLMFIYSSNLASTIALLNIIVIPYTFWSLWYQKVKAKKWCILCLNVQFQIWILFTINLIFKNVQFYDIAFINVIVVLILYIILVLATHFIIRILSKSMKLVNLTQEINSIKASDSIFSAVMNNQLHSPNIKNYSSIIFGNIDSNNLITVFSNPHCRPCAKVHDEIEHFSQTKWILLQYNIYLLPLKKSLKSAIGF